MSTVLRTNMITSKNKKVIIASNSDLYETQVDFNAWNDDPHFLWQWTNAANQLKLQTKDIDFGNPSRRKKIYKVYVTFKAGGYMSGVKMEYATNGSNTFTGNSFKSTTYYSNTKGFDSFNSAVADSTDDWITVALKPSSSINNVYSLQLKFLYADAGRFSYAVGANSATDDTGTTIQLDVGASSTDDYYNGMPLFIYSGPGYGPDYRVIDYNGTNKQVTVDKVKDGVNDTGDTITDSFGYPSNGRSAFDVGFIPKQFSINDISIVYREKPIK